MARPQRRHCSYGKRCHQNSNVTILEYDNIRRLIINRRRLTKAVLLRIDASVYICRTISGRLGLVEDIVTSLLLTVTWRVWPFTAVIGAPGNFPSATTTPVMCNQLNSSILAPRQVDDVLLSKPSGASFALTTLTVTALIASGKAAESATLRREKKTTEVNNLILCFRALDEGQALFHQTFICRRQLLSYFGGSGKRSYFCSSWVSIFNENPRRMKGGQWYDSQYQLWCIWKGTIGSLQIR